jgi:hypothetical protein
MLLELLRECLIFGVFWCMIESDHVNPCDKCRLEACANLWLYVLMDKVCAHTHGCTFA